MVAPMKAYRKTSQTVNRILSCESAAPSAQSGVVTMQQSRMRRRPMRSAARDRASAPSADMEIQA